jgi:hypothetical protein
MKRELEKALVEYEPYALSQVDPTSHFEWGFKIGWQACVAQRKKERRKTVAAKPAVQQRKVSTVRVCHSSDWDSCFRKCTSKCKQYY